MHCRRTDVLCCFFDKMRACTDTAKGRAVDALRRTDVLSRCCARQHVLYNMLTYTSLESQEDECETAV